MSLKQEKIEKNRIRSERNKASALNSRLRSEIRETELENEVNEKSIKNKELKKSIDAQRAELLNAADTIESCISRDEAMLKYPALYNALNTIEKAKEKCSWTFSPDRKPE